MHLRSKKKNKEEEKKGEEIKEKTPSSANNIFDHVIEDVNQIPVNKFIPGVAPELKKFFTCTVYGKRRSGKSVFGKWFLQAFRHEIPWAWAFTFTKFNSHYLSFLPSKFVFEGFNSGLLEDIMDRQRKAVKLYLKKPKEVNPCALVIWDDLNGHEIKYNPVLRNYYFTGRHYATLNLFMTQHVTETPPAIRSNTDLAVLFNTDYADSLTHYYNDFAGKMSRSVFNEIFLKHTREAHHFLAIVNDPNCPMEKKFYTGIADELPATQDFILGCQEYWKDSQKQLRKICEGEFQENADLLKELSNHVEPPKQRKRKASPKEDCYALKCAIEKYDFPPVETRVEEELKD